ncbi:uncharacterized protein LOC115875356 [Sitophilus oryzae]|uniref:Uncharacterized protein LOC115875356 n=1 Tax=Sitophilus oryzae TaxID=7048 RepID=A0A6J2X631_SITOR|nr:uncharacterized protein LOC115875356 [Sitophilus oryzae]
MRRGVKVNYPQKKPKLKLEDLGDVKEPERHSMYQVLMDNLKIAKRNTYLHRIIYIGEHKFPCFDDASAVFQQIINKCNETYCIEKLSGFFLYYSQYFVHMVEGDEDNLNKHLKYLLDVAAEHAPYLGNMKLLIHISHINQRFIDGWMSYTSKPAKLLEKLDIEADLQYSARFIYNFIKKIYFLCSNYADDQTKIDEREKSMQSVSASSNITNDSPSLIYHEASIQMSMSQLTGRSTQKEYIMYLPEYELLDFAIKTSFTMPLREYSSMYGVVPMRDIYKDRVWPVPHDFIPYDIFEQPYTCMTELPKENRIPSAFYSPSCLGLIEKKEASQTRQSITIIDNLSVK